MAQTNTFIEKAKSFGTAAASAVGAWYVIPFVIAYPFTSLFIAGAYALGMKAFKKPVFEPIAKLAKAVGSAWKDVFQTVSPFAKKLDEKLSNGPGAVEQTESKLTNAESKSSFNKTASNDVAAPAAKTAPAAKQELKK